MHPLGNAGVKVRRVHPHVAAQVEIRSQRCNQLMILHFQSLIPWAVFYIDSDAVHLHHSTWSMTLLNPESASQGKIAEEGH